MGFNTRIDYSSNRQLKQYQFTNTVLSGTTTFGVPDNYIPENISGYTINVDALQYIKTRGLIFQNELPINNSIAIALGRASDGVVISIPLSGYLQTLTFSASTGELFISSGNTVNLSGLTSNSVPQTLSLSGNSLSISSGNTISLSGLTGTQGVQGVQGKQGVQGTTGAQGVQGVQGRQGVQGTIGAQGVQGVQGKQGVQGATGAQGVSGLTGSQGVQGVSGVTGSQGVQGVIGLQGISGLTGSQGIQGVIGTQGISGLTGTQGVQGIQGLLGNGIQGPSGAGELSQITMEIPSGLIDGSNTTYTLSNTGTTAIILTVNGVARTEYTLSPDGTIVMDFPLPSDSILYAYYNIGIEPPIQGVQGTQGVQGLMGTSGLTGSQGVSGLTGSQGTQGVQGLLGSGIQGLTGTSGDTGSQGVQGIQGVSGLTSNSVPQTLSLSGNSLSISSGNTISLSGLSGGGSSVAYKEVPPEVVNGSNTVFSTINTPISIDFIWLYLDGVARSSFTFNSSLKQLTLAFAPVTGTVVEIQYISTLAEPFPDITVHNSLSSLNTEPYLHITVAEKSQYASGYTHSLVAHAPANAQKNSDILKSEIEAVFSGEVSSHTHNIISTIGVAELKNELKATISATTTSATTINWSDGIQFKVAMSGNTTVSFSNIVQTKAIILVVTGNYVLTLPTGVDPADLTGFIGTNTNYINIYCVDSVTPVFLTNLISK